MTSSNGGTAVNVVLSGENVRPFFTFVTLWVIILAVVAAISLTGLIIAMQAKTEARLSEYDYSQLREFMSQKGYPLPSGQSRPADQRSGK